MGGSLRCSERRRRGNRKKTPANVKSNQGDELTYELFIDAAPETVFEFFVEPRAMATWFGVSHELEPRPGGLFRVEVSPGYVARGVYKLLVRPHRVVFTWGWEDAADPVMRSLGPGESVIEVNLEPKGSGTVMKFRHSLLSKEIVKRHDERWSVHLSRLVGAVRTN